MVFNSGLLHVDSNQDGKILRQHWVGRVNDLRPAAALDGYIAPVVERARSGGLTIEHHFEKLEYFNSAFISWVIHQMQRALELKVKTVMYFEPKSHMHRSSFDALRVLQRDNPFIELVEAQSAS
ncbi:MAG TPA: hypothetical protein VLW85_07295 [Myxococcales bacterium]|nr:hypothetical protein [Myxococcales bacterium]